MACGGKPNLESRFSSARNPRNGLYKKVRPGFPLAPNSGCRKSLPHESSSPFCPRKLCKTDELGRVAPTDQPKFKSSTGKVTTQVKPNVGFSCDRRKRARRNINGAQSVDAVPREIFPQHIQRPGPSAPSYTKSIETLHEPKGVAPKNGFVTSGSLQLVPVHCHLPLCVSDPENARGQNYQTNPLLPNPSYFSCLHPKL